MDELKLLIEMVASLPAMAVWVLVGFFAYKVTIIGSIYGVIRFCVDKFVQWRTFVPQPVKPLPLEYDMKGIAMNEGVALAMTAQLTRLARKNYTYFHMDNVKELERAIDAVLEERNPAK